MPENIYYSISTNFGIQKQINCLLNGTGFDLWEIAVGDSSGNLYEPGADQNSLKNETWRGKITNCTQDGNKYYCTTVIPADAGGFTIREAGIFDQSGNLLLISKFPETIKQSPESGTVKELTIRIEVLFINEDIKTLIINPNINTASTDFVSNYVETVLQNYLPLNEKGEPNGYAPLDENSKIPEQFLSENTAGKNIGDVFWTMRLDGEDDGINGAYDCQEVEFSRDDFEGAQNPYDLIIAEKLPAVTYEEYQTIKDNNNGNCGFFGVDTDNQKFKTPIYDKISFEAGSINDIGKYIQDQIVNIVGQVQIGGTGSKPIALQNFSGAFVSGGAHGSTMTRSESGHDMPYQLKIDASQTVKTGDRVKGRTVTLRAMVQLAAQGQDISIAQYTQQLQDLTVTKLDEIEVQGDAEVNRILEVGIQTIQSLDVPEELPLLSYFYSDKLINNPIYHNSQGQWLEKADAPQAYNYLVEQWNSGTDANTTAADITLYYRNTPDGFKITGTAEECLKVEQIYAGNACYYQLDIVNERFKVRQKPINEQTLANDIINDDKKYLYYKLGNVVQNAQLVNVARMEAKYSAMLANNNLTLRVPEDFPTLQEALDYSGRTTASGVTIIGAGKDSDPVIIPAGQKIFIPPGNKVELQNFRFLPDASEHAAYSGIIHTESGTLYIKNSRIEIIASSAVAASVRIIASFGGRIDISESVISTSSTNSNIVLASAHQEGFMGIWNSTLSRTSSSLPALLVDTGSTIQISGNSITGSFSPALNSSGNSLSQIMGSNP
jgi:hypothetical protein